MIRRETKEINVAAFCLFGMFAIIIAGCIAILGLTINYDINALGPSMFALSDIPGVPFTMVFCGTLALISFWGFWLAGREVWVIKVYSFTLKKPSDRNKEAQVLGIQPRVIYNPEMEARLDACIAEWQKLQSNLTQERKKV